MMKPAREREQPSRTERDMRETTQHCPDCESSTLVVSPERDELVCDGCGLIIEERMVDHGPEWRAFTARDHQEKSRVGAPLTPTIHDRGLSTHIGWKDEDAHGRPLKPRQRTQMARLRRMQKLSHTAVSRDKNLTFALGEIDRMASALGLPDVVRETASVIYRRALREELIYGRSIEGMATAALYLACHGEDVPRSLDDVAQVSRVDRKEIGRAKRYLATELGIHVKPIEPAQYLPRFCSELDASHDLQLKAKEILDQTTRMGLHVGKSPSGFAAAAIYAASVLMDGPVTQQAVAEAANTSEVTIRNRYQEQLDAITAID